MKYLCIIYNPFGNGLPSETEMEQPSYGYVTSYREGGDLVPVAVKIGLNVIPLDKARNVRPWLARLKEEIGFSDFVTEVAEPKAADMVPSLAIEVINTLSHQNDIDLFCNSKDPKVVAAQTKRSNLLRRLQGGN